MSINNLWLNLLKFHRQHKVFTQNKAPLRPNAQLLDTMSFKLMEQTHL